MLEREEKEGVLACSNVCSNVFKCIGVLGTKLSEESISNYTVSASLHLSEASQSLPSPPRLLEKNIINRKWKQRSVL